MSTDRFESLLRHEARSTSKVTPEGLERGILTAIERSRGESAARRAHPGWLLILTAATTALATIALTQRARTPQVPTMTVVSHGAPASLGAIDPLERESAALEGQARVAAAYLADAFTPGKHPRT